MHYTEVLFHTPQEAEAGLLESVGREMDRFERFGPYNLDDFEEEVEAVETEALEVIRTGSAVWVTKTLIGSRYFFFNRCFALGYIEAGFNAVEERIATIAEIGHVGLQAGKHYWQLSGYAERITPEQIQETPFVETFDKDPGITDPVVSIGQYGSLGEAAITLQLLR